jgi:hypothetical protein
MTGTLQQISGLLHEAGETHRQVSGSSMEPTMTGHPGMRSGSSTYRSYRTCSASRLSAAS